MAEEGERYARCASRPLVGVSVRRIVCTPKIDMMSLRCNIRYGAYILISDEECPERRDGRG